ncbi:MAG: hypothetical protein BGP06_12735 [Rhizobiales bacterium 65-9]|nr:MAG: hypothetical protein BGP06_12735 [Rhizobiales bacterium 65-9]
MDMTTDSTAALDLQAAIRAHLIADADFLAALGGPKLFDGAPRGTAFPYVTLGPASQGDWSDGEVTGADVALTLNVWSRAAGKREAWAIVGLMMRLLHDATLTLPTRRLVTLSAVFAEVRRESDSITERGVLRLSALVEG